MDFNPANQQLLQWYINCYHFLNEIIVIDLAEIQEFDLNKK